MGVSTTAKRGDARGTARSPSHLQHEVVGVVLITLALLVFLSLISFAPSDSGVFDADNSAPGGTRNMIGAVGATLARALFGFLGGSAYLLPFLLVMVAFRCFVEGTLAVTIRSAAGALVSLLFLSGLLHLEMPAVPTVMSGLVNHGMGGGASGRFMAGALRTYFASTGAHIILLAGLLVSLLLATPTSLADLWQRLPVWREAFLSVKERIAAVMPERTKVLDPVEPSKKTKTRPVKINRPRPVEEEPPVPAEASPAMSEVDTLPSPQSSHAEEEQEFAIRSTVRSGYKLPDPSELLSDSPAVVERMSDEFLKSQSDVLTRALQSFGIEGKVTEVHPGPVVTMYEFQPAPGVKVARIVNLADDVALALKATSLRIVAPLPGKSVVGIEVPNPYRETVSLKEVIMSDAFLRSRSKLILALGKDIFGVPATADLKSMPHLLVAGATGAGKSVGLNTMLLSILFCAKPDEVKLLLVDPKMLELQAYDGVPHLLRPVITDAKSAARGLTWVVQEMERRYKLLAEAGVRNIDSYNRHVADAQGIGRKSSRKQEVDQPELPMEFLSEEDRLSAGEDMTPDPVLNPPKTPPVPLPYIVVMIDELADLMMVAPKEVEEKIARLAQMARASGIHLVLATQRPSVDVLTGLIKANFPARIAFQVSSKTDSRTILDSNGAEALLGRGDMLYLASGTGKLMRLHGSFVPDEDVRKVVEFVKKQAAPAYSEELQSLQQEEVAEEHEKDEVYEQAKDLVLTSGQASASLIQRRLRVGYPRAARMIERMQEEGIVSAAGRDGRREVIGRKGPVGEDSL
jgi:S-DNA-T family DNA segregation ATPase FtsK/SpoIIIE